MIKQGSDVSKSRSRSPILRDAAPRLLRMRARSQREPHPPPSFSGLSRESWLHELRNRQLISTKPSTGILGTGPRMTSVVAASVSTPSSFETRLSGAPQDEGYTRGVILGLVPRIPVRCVRDRVVSHRWANRDPRDKPEDDSGCCGNWGMERSRIHRTAENLRS